MFPPQHYQPRPFPPYGRPGMPQLPPCSNGGEGDQRSRLRGLCTGTYGAPHHVQPQTHPMAWRGPAYQQAPGHHAPYRKYHQPLPCPAPGPKPRLDHAQRTCKGATAPFHRKDCQQPTKQQQPQQQQQRCRPRDRDSCRVASSFACVCLRIIKKITLAFLMFRLVSLCYAAAGISR